MTPIFIICQHRTGSTLLKNILHAHSNVHMAFDEMNIFERLKKNSLDRLVGNQIKTSTDFVNALQNKKIYGTFWTDFEKTGIDLINLKKKIDTHVELNIKTIIVSVLEILKEKSNRNVVGVKYPVHFSKVDFLFKQFPESRIVFLTRNPKSIIASKLKDPATKMRKKKSILHTFIIHYFTLFYFCWDFRKSLKMYRKNKSKLFKLSYESLLLDPKKKIKALCEFCNLDYTDEMLKVTGKQSSHSTNNEIGLKLDSINKYKFSLSLFDQWLIDLMTLQSYKKFSS